MEREPPAFGPGRPVYHIFWDSSALVALYVDEPGTDVALRAFRAGYSSRVSEIAYPEARSAFARLHRSGVLDDEHLSLVVGWLDEDWDLNTYDPIAPDKDVCRRAGYLAQKHSLRAFDAVQLATALHLRENYRPGPPGDIVHFFTFDERLRRAAEAEERLRVYEPPPDADVDGDGDSVAGEGVPGDEA